MSWISLQKTHAMQSPKRLPVIVLLFAGLSLTTPGCKKNNDAAPGNPPADTTASSGGPYNTHPVHLSLDGGHLTVDIPAGAMDKGTQVSLGSSDKKFVDAAHVLHQFELKPAGTRFQKPVTLTFHYDSAWLAGGSPWNTGIAYLNEADGKWYPAVNGEVDTADHTISIRTTHFSHWSIYTCFHLYMKAGGQLSEDGSDFIKMQSGDIGLLLLTMDEPPAWKNDPDKSKYFSNPLVAPLMTPPIDPRESYSKSLAPDQWDVNGIANGDGVVGKIAPVAGAAEKLFQYLAPPEIPEKNPVSVAATIHTVSHGYITVIQPVEIKGKWQLDITDSLVMHTGRAELIYAYHFGTRFHIDDNDQLVYDGENHNPIHFYKATSPGVVSWTITSADYMEAYDITGSYDGKTNELNCQLTADVVPGATTQVICDENSCGTFHDDGSQYGSSSASGTGESFTIKALSGATYSRDTVITVDGGSVTILETGVLHTVEP